MNETKKKIIVTGGYGFIGSHMVRSLVNDGHEVVVFTKKDSNPERVKDLLPKLTVIDEDLTDKARLTQLMKELKPNGVFHYAASNIQSGVTAADEEVVGTNIVGLANLLNSLEQVDYDFFINIGSFLECGIQDHPLREDDLAKPVDLYAISKLGGTLYCQAVGKKSKKPVVTLRLMTPYGLQMQSGRLMFEMVNKALKGEEIELNDPKTSRDFLYIDDIIELNLEVAANARELCGEIFYMGSGKATTLGELSDMVLKKTNSKSTIKWGRFKKLGYDSDMWVADMTKTFGTFKWRPKVGLEEGIDKMIEWLKK